MYIHVRIHVRMYILVVAKLYVYFCSTDPPNVESLKTNIIRVHYTLHAHVQN